MRHTEDKFELPFIVVNEGIIQDKKIEIVDEKNNLKLIAAEFTIID